MISATLMAQDDPTGWSPAATALVSFVILLGSLVVLIRWWVQLRRRDRDR
jgi:hypothetical protein